MFIVHLAATLPAISVAPIVDPIYAKLPGGSFFGFLLSLPGGPSLASTLLGLPGSDSVLSLLGQYGITG